MPSGQISIHVRCQCRADIMFSYTYLDVIDGDGINGGVPLYYMYGQFAEFVSDRLLCPDMYIGNVMEGNFSALTARGMQVRGIL